MNIWIIIAIVAAVVLAVAVLVFLKSKKGNKTPSNMSKTDRELIEMNSKAIDVLISLCGGEGYVKELQELREKLKYLVPSTSQKVYDWDKKIKGKIEDAKIALTKADDKGCEKVKTAIDEIFTCVAERNMYV